MVDRLGSALTPLAHGVLAVMLVCSALVVLGADPAAACSCDGGTPESLLATADVAFIGEFVERIDEAPSGVRDRFRVKVWLTGDLGTAEVEVVSSGDGVSCGLDLRIGQSAAIYTTRMGDDLRGGSCSTLDPALVRASLRPLGVQTREPAVFVVRAFESPHLYLLDANGLIAGYAEREVDPTFRLAGIDRCPGDERLLEWWTDGTLIVREVATLDVVREMSVDATNLRSAHCMDRAGDDVVRAVFTGPSRVWMALVDADDDVIAEGRFSAVEAVGDGLFIAEGGSDSGAGRTVTVRRIDRATGATSDVVEIPAEAGVDNQDQIFSFVASPDRSMVAFESNSYTSGSSDTSGDGHSIESTELIVVEADTGATVARSTRSGDVQVVDWTTEGLVVIGRRGTTVLDPLTFEPLLAEPLAVRWPSHLVDERLVGFEGPRLLSVATDGTDPRVINTLADIAPGIVGVLSTPVAVTTDSPTAPAPDPKPFTLPIRDRDPAAAPSAEATATPAAVEPTTEAAPADDPTAVTAPGDAVAPIGGRPDDNGGSRKWIALVALAGTGVLAAGWSALRRAGR